MWVKQDPDLVIIELRDLNGEVRNSAVSHFRVGDEVTVHSYPGHNYTATIVRVSESDFRVY
jgi:NADPH:quinone reductase-like Zn-dependent oxidoreductase